ncbi:methylated-DNA--[protein]-cysteine S-methyltransferase [Motiliproteus sediminis]|uniref:methylated-DNA--[protein]-cysteine S-methyltransferase n=1 Tax=Motiliproteus sediminis TaxID=1468178 RepID=UPI001AEFD7FB|nr:methylated-DNA--[protein]-cysteine S-methyltransferase [Motiliproteus sediminis]
MPDPLLEQQRHYHQVAAAIDYLATNARQQPSLSQVAEAVHLSEHHLQRLFSQWAGISPKRFLQFLNKEHAKQALQRSEDVVTTALSTGLSSTGRLHDLMISCEAMTPGEIRTGGTGLIIGYGIAPSCFGDALLAWTTRGLCYLAFIDDDLPQRQQELQQLWPNATLQQDSTGAVTLATRIFCRSPQPGRLHLVLRGTNFQLKVWEALLAIPAGELVSYSQLAALAGSPKAQRAVGSALARNHVGFLIPCHRVIRESGDIGQYRWGNTRKRALQAWEAAQQADHYPAGR